MDDSLATKKAITYSLLAHIKNSGVLTSGTLDIFIPLVKKVLHFMTTNKLQYKGEHISEIQKIIEESYGIDMPISTLGYILKKIAHEINKESTILTIYKDNSFTIKNYFFDDYNKQIEDNKKGIDTLQKLFKEFCTINNINHVQNDCIIKFIEKNKLSISRYLSITKEEPEGDYTIVAQFIDYFKNIPNVYSLIKNLYLGSILTCYLEYQPNNAQMGVILLLDTNFIVSLLDLNTPESTHTCQKVLEICRVLGYKFQVLKDTIEETQRLLISKSHYFEKAIITKYVNREDIYNACERKNLNSVDLDRIADNLENTLTSLGISTIPYTDSLRKAAKYSKEYELLKPYRNSERAAIHDAMAILYVKEKRGKKKIKTFEKVNCWFVNNSTSHDSDKESIDALLNSEQNQFQPEIIKADDLLNILWLSSPSINIELADSELVDIGLTSLVALTLNDSLPKNRVIKELDENIQKYKGVDFTDKDVLLLATRITQKQIQNVDSLNEIAKIDSVKFAEKIKEEAKKQEEIENIRTVRFGKMLEDLSKGCERIEKLQQTLTQNNSEKENLSLKKELREIYIANEIKHWRRKTWFHLFIVTILFIAGIIWILIICDLNFTKASNMLNGIMQNIFIAGIFTLTIFLINLFIIKQLYNKYNNYSNIESYKKSLTIPEKYT